METNFDYLVNHPKRSFEGMHGEFRVIHEGLSNHPALRQRILELADKLIQNANNTNSHLSDIACHLSFMQNDLLQLTKDIFQAHETEKNLDL